MQPWEFIADNRTDRIILDKEQKDRIVAAHHADHKWRKTKKCLYVNSNQACSNYKNGIMF